MVIGIARLTKYQTARERTENTPRLVVSKKLHNRDRRNYSRLWKWLEAAAFKAGK